MFQWTLLCCRTLFTGADRKFIEDCRFFFLATADADGRPDCSFKGGPPGFVRVPEPDLLVFPDYRGNGMLRRRQSERSPACANVEHGHSRTAALAIAD